MVIRIGLEGSVTATSFVAIPRNETSRTGFPVTFMVKLPSRSVEVPVLVPLMSTAAPGTGSPNSSTTLPLICATLSLRTFCCTEASVTEMSFPSILNVTGVPANTLSSTVLMSASETEIDTFLLTSTSLELIEKEYP